MLSVWTWILLSMGSILFTLYMYTTTFLRRRRPGEPPVVKGHPIWGSAAEFNQHAVNFLHRAQKSYGNVFTIRLINQYLTIIMDPHSFEPMSKERNFDFDPIQKQVNWNVFSFVLKEPKKIIKDTGRTVRGPNLQRSICTYIDNLNYAYDQVMPKEIGQQDAWQKDGLRFFASKTVFNALFNTIFGRSDDHPFNSRAMYRNFEVFHKYFNYFWLGVPKKWFPPAMKALEGMLVQPGSEEMLQRDDLSDYIKTAINYMKMHGQTDAEIMGHNLVYLHVNYNTFRLAFWALSYILEDEKVLSVLMDEINTAIDENRDESGKAVFGMKDIENMEVLDSICNETCRLSSGVFMVRYVNEDTHFQTTDGKDHLMRQGDRVAIYPPALHKDPEIFEDPLEFKYDRFIDAKFYKDGLEVKHPIMAFGSLCPGKRYALLQLKWYLVTMFNHFEMELLDGEHAEYDYQYHGHEVLPPKKDIQFRYRLRKDAAKLELHPARE